jgi:predicted glycosyltransferase
MTRVAFLCCHLSGTGHLVRTLTLARATAALGAEVLVIGGGRPLDHVDLKDIGFLQLPPVHVPDFDFSTLRKPSGDAADDAYLAARRLALQQALTDFRPDALVTELFPLGRRTLAAEFEAAIAATRAANPARCHGAAIIASARDIPEPPKKPGRLEQAAERLRRHYNALLVHGDADFLPLEATWPLPDDLAPMIHHTGYVASDPPPLCDTPGETVLVAVGGGVLGRRLLSLAAKAAALSPRPWHLLTGGADAADLARNITARYGRTNLTIEPARPDYQTLLAEAACSVSLAGYNTVLDLAGCATPAIIVPFDEHGEVEQVIRAERLARLDGFTVLRVGALTPEILARAAETAATAPRRTPLALARNGAVRAAARILEIAAK